MVELGLDTSMTGEAGGQEEGGREDWGAGEGTACMHSVQLQLGAAVADLGTWGFVTVCVELMYVKPCV